MRKDDNHGRKKNRKALAGRADAARRHRRYHVGLLVRSSTTGIVLALDGVNWSCGVVLRHPVMRAAAGLKETVSS